MTIDRCCCNKNNWIAIGFLGGVLIAGSGFVFYCAIPALPPEFSAVGTIGSIVAMVGGVGSAGVSCLVLLWPTKKEREQWEARDHNLGAMREAVETHRLINEARERNPRQFV